MSLDQQILQAQAVEAQQQRMTAMVNTSWLNTAATIFAISTSGGQTQPSELRLHAKMAKDKSAFLLEAFGLLTVQAQDAENDERISGTDTQGS